MASTKSIHHISIETDVVLLDCTTAFENLTKDEQFYAHYLSCASFYGSLIVLYQTSPESPGIFLFLLKLFQRSSLADFKASCTRIGWTEDDVKGFLVWAAAFFCNMGNYKSFGDSKFVPTVSKDKLEALVKSLEDFELLDLFSSIISRMYSLDGKMKQLGLGEKGTTTYFSENCTEEDAQFIQEFMQMKSLSPYNTRLFKTVVDGKVAFEIRLASVFADHLDCAKLSDADSFTDKSGMTALVSVTRGDYSSILQYVVAYLNRAQEYAANDAQRDMLRQYAESFSSGSIDAHKEGSRFWIRDKAPAVESYIGFIESYRDPVGTRGEFEGFVAMVNRPLSLVFSKLVDNAEDFLPLLPWGVHFEKDRFLKPDFTSLDVLTFAGSGIPAGINIPNYDCIRQDYGFKNVSLGNVLSASYKDAACKITFLTPLDKEVMCKYKLPSFEVQVGLHELLGHGSGKLMIETDGSFNWDSSVVNPLTGDKITTWYKDGETWDTKFGSVASAYEECRAECVGLLLSTFKPILRVFGHEGTEADDVLYVNWLCMVRAGLLGLEFYSPETNKWRQAHMHARFVILQTLLQAQDDFVTITPLWDSNDLLISLDRTKIQTTGKKAINDFLLKIQVYKSTADVDAGRKLFDSLSQVDETFLKYRDIVLDHKVPRKLIVQCNTRLTEDNSSVALIPYNPDSEGIVQSWIERFPDDMELHESLEGLWHRDMNHFSL